MFVETRRTLGDASHTGPAILQLFADVDDGLRSSLIAVVPLNT
jgi:hypothetical protein